MNVAKYLLLTAILAVLLLPVMELAAFIAVAAQIGFLPALALIAMGSVSGVLILRHAGGGHIARVKVALGNGSFTTLQADSSGVLVLLAGILLAIPGFITDVLGLLLLVAPLRRAIGAALGGQSDGPRADGVVDLPPEQWRRVPDRELPDRRGARDG
ncbi:MAG TPA: FxsA family protein [Pseudolabrys sp.]|nr:FxsA family protein [Pseudolabrys sp.]